MRDSMLSSRQQVKRAKLSRGSGETYQPMPWGMGNRDD
jgi:hypothetical protein